jgi:hypothetical protein
LYWLLDTRVQVRFFGALQELINNLLDNMAATSYIIEFDFVFILFKIYVQVKAFTDSLTLAANVSRLCVVADFGAQNCQPTTNVDLKNYTLIYH